MVKIHVEEIISHLPWFNFLHEAKHLVSVDESLHVFRLFTKLLFCSLYANGVPPMRIWVNLTIILNPCFFLLHIARTRTYQLRC